MFSFEPWLASHSGFDVQQALQCIAASEHTSKRRIQQMIDLAFLAPDIVKQILDGTQPLGLTSDWLLRHTLPIDWEEQRALISRL